MKQRITVEQLKELTLKQQNKLRDWWKPNEGNYLYTPNDYCDVHLFSTCCSYEDDEIVDGEFGGEWHKNDILPILDIRQMIEFIYDYDDCFEIDSSSNWYIDTKCIIPNIKTDNEELCDALWEAVKQVLQ